MGILTTSNALSLFRGSLAFLFLSDNPLHRFIALFLAVISDGLDGYLARRFKMTSRFGAVLDPLMDKFFALFVLCVFFLEKKIFLWQALAFMARDIAIFFYCLYLAYQKQFFFSQVRSIWTGKVFTSIQFFLIIPMIYHYPIPDNCFFLLIFLGFMAFFELIFFPRREVTG